MKSFYDFLPQLLALILIVFFVQDINSASRYKDIVFPSVSVTKDIQFGSNKGIDGSTVDLFLDLYEPENDTLTNRPLVIFLHGGSLISGTRSAMEYQCIDFAKRGYVSATIEYRLGIESPKGVKTILEALLRGVQDTKAAVRFLRSRQGEYGIDTSKIYIEGSSAGSMIAVHYAYWDQDEIPSDIDQTKWGNIEGTSGNPGFSSSINGIVNYCGAIIDPAWIDAGEIAVANFHGLLDPVVPPDDGISTDFGIRLHGGVAISRAANQLGIYNQGAFFPNMSHGGNEDSLRIFSANFIYTLMVLSSAVPQDFTSMALSAKSLRIFRFDTYNFLVTALDKSGNRIILPQSMIEYSCSSPIGSITPYGMFVPADIPGTGFVYAKFNNVVETCSVTTYDLKYFVMKPGTAVTDTARTIQFRIDTYDADSIKHDLAITKFKLTSTAPSIGEIDSTGIFIGKKNGTTKIIASLSGYSDTSIVKVENASGIAVIDVLDNLSGWTFTHSNLDSISTALTTDQKSQGTASFKIDYKLTYKSGTTYWIYLDKDITVYGIPDSVYLDVKSDGRKHKIFYRLVDADNEIFRASGKRYLDDSLMFANINTPMTGLAPLSGGSELNYPLTLKRIEIQLAPNNVQGTVTSGTLYIDNLRFKYPGEGSGIVIPPTVFYLEQNYPNPFNAGTVIDFNLVEGGKVTLKIYDILGCVVKTLIDRDMDAGFYSIPFTGAGLSSGTYFYRLETSQHSVVKKMMLLK